MTVELADYQCRRNLDTFDAGTHGLGTRQCFGRMVATHHVATRVPTVTCDVCGRQSAAEVALVVTNPDGTREPWSLEWQVRDDARDYMRRMYGAEVAS